MDVDGGDGSGGNGDDDDAKNLDRTGKKKQWKELLLKIESS